MQNKSAESVISQWEEKLSGFICLPGGPLGILAANEFRLHHHESDAGIHLLRLNQTAF